MSRVGKTWSRTAAAVLSGVLLAWGVGAGGTPAAAAVACPSGTDSDFNGDGIRDTVIADPKGRSTASRGRVWSTSSTAAARAAHSVPVDGGRTGGRGAGRPVQLHPRRLRRGPRRLQRHRRRLTVRGHRRGARRRCGPDRLRSRGRTGAGGKAVKEYFQGSTGRWAAAGRPATGSGTRSPPERPRAEAVPAHRYPRRSARDSRGRRRLLLRERGGGDRRRRQPGHRQRRCRGRGRRSGTTGSAPPSQRPRPTSRRAHRGGARHHYIRRRRRGLQPHPHLRLPKPLGGPGQDQDVIRGPRRPVTSSAARSRWSRTGPRGPPRPPSPARRRRPGRGPVDDRGRGRRTGLPGPGERELHRDELARPEHRRRGGRDRGRGLLRPAARRGQHRPEQHGYRGHHPARGRRARRGVRRGRQGEGRSPDRPDRRRARCLR